MGQGELLRKPILGISLEEEIEEYEERKLGNVHRGERLWLQCEIIRRRRNIWAQARLRRGYRSLHHIHPTSRSRSLEDTMLVMSVALSPSPDTMATVFWLICWSLKYRKKSHLRIFIYRASINGILHNRKSATSVVKGIDIGVQKISASPPNFLPPPLYEVTETGGTAAKYQSFVCNTLEHG